MDGRVVAQKIRADIKQQLRGLKVQPNLTTILVGDTPASKVYIQNIHAACTDVGIASRKIELAANVSQEHLRNVISELNDDSSTTGILLQFPLPKGFDEVAVTSDISVEKDVDGLNPHNLGLLFQKGPRIIPCTPEGVLVLLKYYSVQMAGKHAVIINRTKIVGRPLSQLLLNEDATVTVCHSKTEGLIRITKEADILLTAIGRRPNFTVGAEMMKVGAVVVDIGLSSLNGKLVGDVDFDSAVQVASLVTPVPGGVGPMTIAMILYNTLYTACSQNGVELMYHPSELRAPEPS